MWPLGCATTLHGSGQPHAYHVVNRYFDEFFPLAASLGDQYRASGGDDKFIWMTQSWVVSLFLNCESAYCKFTSNPPVACDLWVYFDRSPVNHCSVLTDGV